MYDDLGIETEGTRLHAIQTVAENLQADLAARPHEDVVNRWSNQETYYALSDGAAFGRIAREIPKVGPNLLPRRKLQTVLEGPLYLTEDQPGDESVNARNVSTELELAADFSEKGIPPTGSMTFNLSSRAFASPCNASVFTARVALTTTSCPLILSFSKTSRLIRIAVSSDCRSKGSLASMTKSFALNPVMT